jgi:hypothetical protein
VKPGASLIEGVRSIQAQKRTAGVWPYQWLYPGPNARPVNAGAGLSFPLLGAGVTPLTSYQVPTGMRFTLRGVRVGFLGTGWTEGSSQLTFTLQVNGAGSRTVEYLNAVRYSLGSAGDNYEILGTCEFDPLDELQWVCTESGVITPTASIFLIAQIIGWEYPLSESV